MRDDDQIPRNSLAWLLVAQGIILVPHISHAPPWIWAIWLVVIFWRLQIFRGAWGFPGQRVKFLLVSSCCAGLYLAYRGSFGMETMVGLLIVGFVLKLVEMKKRSDLIVVCHLGYFVTATQFLFFSNLLAALYGIISLVVLTATLFASHQSLEQHRFWRTLRLTSVLMLQAVPLMLILFIVVPRIGPLWAVPSNSAGAQTGMSDSMAPGDISDLMRSEELVFRVTFDNLAPLQSSLYWRGLVFSYFDGRRWSQSQQQLGRADFSWSENAPAPWRDQLQYRGEPTDYQIILEASGQPWLFSLAAAESWDHESAGLSRSLNLQRKRPVNQRIQYRVSSFLDYQFEADSLESWQHRQELQLPANSNPETRRIAQQWLTEAGASPEALVQKLLDHFNQRFRYTLQPAPLGEHSVDEFLWQTQEGFCEHFASSFVFFMRAAGIPARVVVGYQGGKLNPLENYFAVRQREAHAWAEIWLEGRGWTRVDPTAAVAPERIEQGADDSLSEEDARLLRNGFARRFPVFANLQLRWDALNYSWSRWVLGYDADVQTGFLQRWFGGLDPWRLVLAVICLVALTILCIIGVMLWQQRKQYANPADRYYTRFCNKIARTGCVRQTGEAPRDFAQRIAVIRPDLTASVLRITELYEWVSYADNQAALKDLKEAIRLLKVSAAAAKGSEKGSAKSN